MNFEHNHHDSQALTHLVNYAASHTHLNGGREWVNLVDGLRQYPDPQTLKPVQMWMAANYSPVEQN